MHYFQDQCQIWNDSKRSWIEEFQRLRLIFEEILKFRRQQESPRTYCELSKRRVRSASYCYIAENSVWRGLPARFLARATCKCLPSGDWCMLWSALVMTGKANQLSVENQPPSPPPSSPASSRKQPPQLWQATILVIVKSLAIFFEKTLKISFSFSFLTVPSTSCTLVFPGYRQVPIHAFPSQRGLNPTVLKIPVTATLRNQIQSCVRTLWLYLHKQGGDHRFD